MNQEGLEPAAEATENALVVGVLASSTGTVFVIAVDGSVKELHAGDPIYAGEVIDTVSSEVTLIKLADGSVRQLPQESAVAATPAVLSGLPEINEGSGEESEEFAELLAAVEAGEDISEKLDDPAAGEAGGAGDSIAAGAQFSRTGGEVDPTAGFDPDIGFPDPIPLTADTEIIANATPGITVDTGNLDGSNDISSESGLSTGSAAATDSEFAGGTFTLSDADGLDDIESVTINGTVIAIADLGNNNVIAGDHGILTVTSYDPSTGIATYTYELTSATTDVDGVVETDEFSLTVSDGTAESAPATIVIEIDDDVPNAVDDSESVSESATDPVSGNVLDNDLHGNGQSGADTPTSLVSWGPETAQYGTITQNADGSYSYTLNNSNADVQGLDDGETLTETFTYTMQDADGDERSATLTITITGENDGPEIEVDPGNPEGANDVVSESGLSTGSAAATDSEFAGGTFTLSDADGLDDIESVTINGTVIAIADLGNNNVIAGDHGILTVTSYDPSTGIATYTYELTSATTDVDGVVETDEFSLTVSDGTAESAPATIVIEIDDDVPNAVDDSESVSESATDPVSGNVLDNDLHGNGQSGADTPTSLVSWGPETAQYGTITQNADGSYSYTLNNSNADVQGLDDGETLTETFTYTMQDADGDERSATLTITITGENDGPEIEVDPGNPEGANDVVSESGLSTGSAAATDSEFAGGTFTLSDADGLDDIESVTINGTVIAIADLGNNNVIAGDHGILTVTSYDPSTGIATYTYELTSATTDVDGVVETDEFSLTVSDGTAESAPATIVIEIDDDVPNAVDDSESVSESATDPVSGNVLDNDLHGNGQSGADTPTSLVSWGPETAQYGTITQNADGSYSYTLNNSNADVQGLDDGETLTETFTYTMQDADGDERSATLTITITGENDGPEIEVDPGNPEGANDVVSESGLSTGSAAATDSEFAGGTFTLSDADGLDDIESVTINGTVIAIADLGNNNVIAGDHGILTVTSYDPSTGIATYTYELTSATTDVDGVVETDEFSLTVSDGTAESAPATIVIEIEDDLPKAIPDTDKVVAGDIATGNVVTGIDVPGGDSNSEDGNADVFGADGQNAGGAVVGVYSDNLGTDGTVGTSFAGQYGSLTINADGSYTYVANEDVPGGGTEVFTYTIQDGDGDTTTAELTINVRDANEEGILIVGSNDDDVPGATTPYVEAPQGSGPGPIEGSDVSDILSGDSGGSTSQAALANIILILDTSGSMDEKIQFTDADGNTSLITRFEALQKAVINLLNQLANGTADQVRVHIVDYDTNAQAIGTFDLIGGSGLADAIAAINALVLGGWTNYEAGLQLALDWANGLTAIDPLTGANVVNQAFFISDGEPNRALNGNSTDINNDTGQISATASLQHILGTGSGDSVSEVAALEAAFGPIEAIGINVGATAENILDQVEGSGGDADNIDTANELIDVLAELNPLLNLAEAGSDVINGGAGNDFIFGDVLYTDKLAIDQGLGTPNGSGWEVFERLENGEGLDASWDRSDTLNYIRTHAAEMGRETLDSNGDHRAGGHDTLNGGSGKDVIFGQEGNDTIDGGLGSDLISGGSGNDLLTGGDGSDLFVWFEGESGEDTVTDFNFANAADGGDILNLADLLEGETGTAANLENYLNISLSGDDTVIAIDANGDGSGTDQTIVLQDVDLVTGAGSQQDIIQSLISNGNLVTDT